MGVRRLSILAVVGLSNDKPVSCCPESGALEYCPLCGSRLRVIEYRGDKPELLALVKREDFRCFVGCVRVELHDKVVDGVDYRGKVFVQPIFHSHAHAGVLSRARIDVMLYHPDTDTWTALGAMLSFWL